MSLDDLLHHLPLTPTISQAAKASIQNLKNQISQLATSLSQIKSQGKLPSQTVVNPKQNVSAITLRNERELQDAPRPTRRGHDREAELELEVAESQPKTRQVQKVDKG